MSTKTLYHGTLIDHKSSIEKYGLYPSVGAFVKDTYGLHMEEDDIPELVFAADKKGLNKTLNAIRAQIAKKLQFDLHDVTEKEIEKHGLLAIIKDEEGFSQKNPFVDSFYSDEEHPPTVERGDYYAEFTVGVHRTLTGKNLINFFKKHGLVPLVYGGLDKKLEAKKKWIIKKALEMNKKLWKVPVSNVTPHLKSLEGREIEEVFYYLESLQDLLDIMTEFYVRKGFDNQKQTKAYVYDVIKNRFSLFGDKKQRNEVRPLFFSYQQKLQKNSRR